MVENPNNNLTQEQIKTLSGKLLQTYQPRIRNAFSKALRLETKTEQIEEIQRLVEFYALQTPQKLELNSAINKDDINLVTWMLITNETVA